MVEDDLLDVGSKEVRDFLRSALSGGRKLLVGDDAMRILTAYGLRTVRFEVATSEDEAVGFAEAIGYPVVLKVVSDEVPHKSDVGGVVLDVGTPADLRNAYRSIMSEVAGSIPEAKIRGIMVEEQVPRGVELILGAKRDGTFGPLLLLGSGGVYAEYLDDKSMRLFPVSERDIVEMTKEVRAQVLLHGHRGSPPADEAALVSAAMRLARLMVDFPELTGIDLNPVSVQPKGKGCIVLDARVAIEKRPVPESAGRAAEESFSAPIECFTRPKSIAVIGASADWWKPGYRVIRNLIDWGFDRAHIYPVNPKAQGSVEGVAFVPRIQEVPEEVDLAFIVTPAQVVPEVMADCAEKKVSCAVIYTSDFSENGNTELERRVAEVARAGGVRICGPNTTGVVSFANRVCASTKSFVRWNDAVRTGKIAVVSQSGGFGMDIVMHMMNEGLGVSHWFAVGNQADLTLADYVDYLARDDGTQTIVLFVEGFRDYARFERAAQHARRSGKRIIAIKSGRSEIGRRSALLHTYALAGDDMAYDAAFRKLGIIRVDSLRELVNVLKFSGRVPWPKGNRVVVVTTSGGVSTMISDICERYEFDLSDFSGQGLTAISALVPPHVAIRNPLDTTGISPQSLIALFEHLAKERADIYLVIHPAPLDEEEAPARAGAVETVSERLTAMGKPFVYCSLIPPAFRGRLEDLIVTKKVLSTSSMEETMATFRKLLDSSFDAGAA